MTESALNSIEVGNGPAVRRIAVRVRDGAAPGLVWLGGFKSDMQGTKAVALDNWAGENGRACIRFDYSGHGESGGEFVDGTIGRWLEDSAAVFERFAKGPQVLIAPAVDFTEELMWNKFSPEVKRQIETTGSWQRPSQYSESAYPITRGLIEDGRKHLLLGGLIETGCPVRILQGVQDPDVPWQHAVDLSSRLVRDDVVLTLVKDGDHRLSRPEDIERLIAAVAEF